MKVSLSTLPPIGVLSDRLPALSLADLKSEHRKAKVEEARFVDALAERGLPTRPTTPIDASSAERLRHRLARLDKKSRPFYRYLVAWRRYIRKLNAQIRIRTTENTAHAAQLRLAVEKNKTPPEVATAKFQRAAQLKERADTLSQVAKLRGARTRYSLALKLYRRRISTKTPASQVLAFELLRIVVELQPTLPGVRVGKFTRGITLSYVDARLAETRELDAHAARQLLEEAHRAAHARLTTADAKVHKLKTRAKAVR